MLFDRRKKLPAEKSGALTAVAAQEKLMGESTEVWTGQSEAWHM